MATWPGGSCWSFCCCVAVLGVITLKPEATSMLSLFWVVLVVVQPAVNANRAMTLTMLNEVRICFIFASSVLWFDWFQRSSGYKCFQLVPFLFHVCHFPKRRRPQTGQSSRAAQDKRAYLWAWFSWVGLRARSRAMPISPPHGVRHNKQL